MFFSKVEIILTPFLDCHFYGQQMGEMEEGKMPRPQRSNPNTRYNAIQLRKEPTPEEAKLWSRIRNDQLGITFRRQHAIGNYVTDFCSPKAKLIIELDGIQHLEQEEYDKERTEYLESMGYRVIRFWNNEVMKNMDIVLLTIMQAVKKDT